MSKIHAVHAVTPGSVWADQRALGRTVVVEAIDGPYAVCTTLTNSHEVQRALNLPADYPLRGNPRDMRGTTCRILLDRFRPTSNGFAFVTATGAHLSTQLTATH
ncbi:hypothetical protein HNP84_002597 [Thermocatellispora tengchongensis]|uniref:Uncharacterized protein n=1 Tax=Thermocatellispora tengchongensis TaxID=1073253 RepID=A0A840P309_9ACTN|nr:hypothetical protein [Thermocatellispora tengchongensis]MBB5132876.1 hypothetical protein [Thermocatellispora tengchongensis]